MATENGRIRADLSYKYVNPKIHYYLRGICDENGLPYKEKQAVKISTLDSEDANVRSALNWAGSGFRELLS